MHTSTRNLNIIVLVLDCVRARNVSAYGYPEATTPHLDAFAANNILFKRAFSPATWTIPTHASMLSGLYLSQHRIESTKADRSFSKAVVPLPVALRSHGYRTAAFSQNVLFGPRYHLDTFDEFYDVDSVVTSRLLLRQIQRMAEQSGGLWRASARYLRKVLGLGAFAEAMMKWIDAQERTAPFFLMANVCNAHYPWAPPIHLLWPRLGAKVKYLQNQEYSSLKPFQFNSGKQQVTDTHRQMWRVLYNSAITHVDHVVGRFLKRLSRWKGWQETVVVITADHGEMLGDYRDIVGHTLSLHDNLIHVPLVMRHPGYRGRLTVDGVVQTLDLYPSILEWSGCATERIHPAQLQRPALSVAMESPGDSGGLAFAEEDYTDSYNPLEGLRKVNPAMDSARYPQRQVAVRSSTHKYISYDDRQGEFYNLVADPAEKHNLIHSDSAADTVALDNLKRALQKWNANLEILPPQVVHDDAVVDPVVEERLRALGYVA